MDLRSGELRRNGLKIKLQEQPFQILTILLERPGEIITREEIEKKLWSEDTFVDFEHSLATAVKKLREALGDSAENPRFVETLPRRGYRFIAPVDVGAIHESPLQIHSIAVLPLENLSGDPEQEYFADGMTEELIISLAKISALKVISRTSMMQYKGTKKPLPQIAKELTVDGVIEGSVLREGGRVRVTAQLIQASTDQHLWAESYERDLRSVLALQSEMASVIAEKVHAGLTPSERTRLASARPVNPEAYEAYLKGKFYVNKMTPEGYEKGLAYLNQAVEKDPTNPLPYAQLVLSDMVSRQIEVIEN